MTRYVDSTEQLVVELLVRDLQRALAFYRAIGFEVLREEETFAVVAWESHRLFLDQMGDPAGGACHAGNERAGDGPGRRSSLAAGQRPGVARRRPHRGPSLRVERLHRRRSGWLWCSLCDP